MGLAKVTYVRAARKDNSVAKKGESYYHWKSGFRGTTRYSKTMPRPSQRESNEDTADVYAVQEEIEDFKLEDGMNAQELIEYRDTWVSTLNEIADRVEEKYNNLPEGLQQSDTGSQLEEKAERIREYADQLENVDDPTDADEEYEDTREAWLENIRSCIPDL